MSDIYDEVDRRETDSCKRLSLNATGVYTYNIELTVKSHSSYALHHSVMVPCKRLQLKTPFENVLA